MIRFKIGRQTKRAGIDPTLSAVVAKERGIALEQDGDYHNCYTYQNDVYNQGNTSFNSFINHCIIITLPRELDCPPYKEEINILPSLYYFITGGCQSSKTRINFLYWILQNVIKSGRGLSQHRYEDSAGQRGTWHHPAGTGKQVKLHAGSLI